MGTYHIRDKSRALTVEGDHLASSSSFKPSKVRWITFDLYRSHSGIFVLHRVGKSRVFHSSDCDNTVNNNLEPCLLIDLDSSWKPCVLCSPNEESAYVFPETDRYFVTRCDSAEGVLEFLSRYDSRTDSVYYTDVSLDLIEDAAEVDNDISIAYYGDDAVIL